MLGINKIFPELLSEIIILALEGEDKTKTFFAIGRVCKKWRDIVDSLYLRELKIPSLLLPDSIKVSSFFRMEFRLDGSSPYPIPTTLPESLSFLKRLGNKLVYSFPDGFYIYSLDDKSHTKITVDETRFIIRNNFENIYALGEDCVVIEMETKEKKIYRFNPDTEGYQCETVNEWIENNPKNFSLDSICKISQIITDENNQTTYLLLTEISNSKPLLLQLCQKNLNLLPFKMVEGSKILGIRNDKVFIRQPNDLILIKSLVDENSESIFDFKKYINSQMSHVFLLRAELAYPFLALEVLIRHDISRRSRTLLCIINTESKDVYSDMDIFNLSVKNPFSDRFNLEERTIKEAKWYACDNTIVITNSESFLIYNLFLKKIRKVPHKITDNFFLSCKVKGYPGVNFVESSIIYVPSQPPKTLYLSSSAVLEDANAIQQQLI